jgi:hypothetical protein
MPLGVLFDTLIEKDVAVGTYILGDIFIVASSPGKTVEPSIAFNDMLAVYVLVLLRKAACEGGAASERKQHDDEPPHVLGNRFSSGEFPPLWNGARHS